MYFHYKSMEDNDAPGAWPCMDPSVMVGGIYKEDHYSIHCYIQNMKALGLVVSEKKIFFYVFPL